LFFSILFLCLEAQTLQKTLDTPPPFCPWRTDQSKQCSDSRREAVPCPHSTQIIPFGCHALRARLLMDRPIFVLVSFLQHLAELEPVLHSQTIWTTCPCYAPASCKPPVLPFQNTTPKETKGVFSPFFFCPFFFSSPYCASELLFSLFAHPDKVLLSASFFRFPFRESGIHPPPLVPQRPSNYACFPSCSPIMLMLVLPFFLLPEAKD